MRCVISCGSISFPRLVDDEEYKERCQRNKIRQIIFIWTLESALNYRAPHNSTQYHIAVISKACGTVTIMGGGGFCYDSARIILQSYSVQRRTGIQESKAYKKLTNHSPHWWDTQPTSLIFFFFFLTADSISPENTTHICRLTKK